MENVLLENSENLSDTAAFRAKSRRFYFGSCRSGPQDVAGRTGGEGPGNHEPVRMPAHTGRSAGGYSGEIVAAASRMMENNLKSISIPDFEAAVAALAQAEKIDIFSVENSNATAADLETKLLYLD